jgi:hypothetical protein
MNMPGFAADASLSKSRWSYRGYGGTSSGADASLTVIAQQDCQSQCASQFQQCLSNCGCPPGFTNCGGICSDLNFDGSNCGTCGHICRGRVLSPPGLHPSPFFCFNGRCLCQFECCEEDEAGNCTQCAIPPAQCP